MSLVHWFAALPGPAQLGIIVALAWGAFLLAQTRDWRRGATPISPCGCQPELGNVCPSCSGRAW